MRPRYMTLGSVAVYSPARPLPGLSRTSTPSDLLPTLCRLSSPNRNLEGTFLLPRDRDTYMGMGLTFLADHSRYHPPRRQQLSSCWILLKWDSRIR